MTQQPELAQQRLDRSDETDRLLRQLFSDATGGAAEGSGLAIVAVGGYGRREMSPFSDVDVVLLHAADQVADVVGEIANKIWYPLWERKLALDHAVRTPDQMRQAAAGDYRAAMGMLDARCVAGDTSLVLSVRSTVLNDWRREARQRVDEVRKARETRIERFGWVQHTAVPDIKESGGGLRDSVILRALVATWLIDVPHGEAEELRSALLDVRDHLHDIAGRRTDRMSPDLVPELAERLSLSPVEADLYVRDLGRRIAYLSRRAWRSLDVALARTGRKPSTSGPKITPLADGVGALDGEVVLTGTVDPAKDPDLVLRMAAAAAHARLPINEASIARLAVVNNQPPEPWSETAKRTLVDLLSAGAGMVDVWEQLDFHGIIDAILPEWAGIRLRGSSSPVHRYTVDRHSLEACAVADRINRDVARPDLLSVAAVLHDIGKGVVGDHSREGAPMAADVARRWGFSADDAAIIGRLVRWHLLLPTIATTRDIEDPLTAANVAELVETVGFLDLLAALTACDAQATSDQAWTSWRRGLIEGLVEKVRARLASTEDVDSAGYAGWPAAVPMPVLEPATPDGIAVEVTPHLGGSLVTIAMRDRQGLLADIAGALTLAGLSIQSARSVLAGGILATMWEVSRPDLDVETVRNRIRAVISGQLDPAAKLTYTLKPDDMEPRVRVLDAMEQTATLLEVRTLDRRALTWKVCRTISDCGWNIRTAHLTTYGDEARDVFYVVDHEHLALYDADAAVLRDKVAAALA